MKVIHERHFPLFFDIFYPHANLAYSGQANEQNYFSIKRFEMRKSYNIRGYVSRQITTNYHYKSMCYYNKIRALLLENSIII